MCGEFTRNTIPPEVPLLTHISTRLARRLAGRIGTRPVTGLLRPFARLSGMEWDPAIGPVFVVVFLSACSFSTFWSFVGVWALQRLNATPVQIGLMFVASALASSTSAWIGGHISDRVGRRAVLLGSTGVQSLLILSLVPVTHSVLLGFGLVVMTGIAGAPGRSAISAIVADSAPVTHDQAYASLRLALNLGVIVGPPLAAGFLLLGGWPAFLVAIALLGAASCLACLTLDSAGGRRRAEGESLGSTLVALVRDRSLGLLLVSTLLGFMVYTGFETVLPLVAVSSFHLSVPLWGLLFTINPLLVLLFQVRLTRRTRRWPAAVKLAGGMLLMGPPFLLLVRTHSVAGVASVLVIFVAGEMLWVPTIQGAVARLAPPNMRGVYMGGYTSSQLLAWMIAPLVGTQLNAALGPDATWAFFASLAVTSAATGFAAACRSVSRGCGR
jgi:MFS family permease